jgi:hypothetical protein
MLLLGSLHVGIMLRTGPREIVLGLQPHGFGLVAEFKIEAFVFRAIALGDRFRSVAFLSSCYHGIVRDRLYDGLNNAL